MKKFIVATALALALVFGVATSADCFRKIHEEEVEGKTIKHVSLVGNWYSGDFHQLLENTISMKKGDTLHMHIYTGGGDAFACVAAINHVAELQRKGVEVITHAHGAVFSAGAFLWMSADNRVAHSGDMFMFHTVMFGAADRPSKLFDENSKKIMMYLNHWIRQKLLDTIGDADIVNEKLLKVHEKDNYNFFTAEEVNEMGLPTVFIEN